MNSATVRCRLVLIVVLTLCASMTFGYVVPQTATTPDSKTAKLTTAMNTSALQDTLGEMPKRWFVPVQGYTARLLAEGAKPGQHSVLLQKEGQSANTGPFGNIMRVFNATPYRGKKLRFRAMVRFEGAPNAGRTQMWMRVDRANRAGMGFFDNMDDRPITDNVWRRYEISGPIADDAAAVNIGLMLLGDKMVVLGFIRGS